MFNWSSGIIVCCISSMRAIQALAIASMLATVSSSLAQNNVPVRSGNNAPRPFQEKASEIGEPITVVTSPQSLIAGMEAWARERDKANTGPLERQFYFLISHPHDAAEFAALARYSLLVLTVVTQKPEELPLKRVYLRTADREIPLLRIASWRRNVDQALLTHKTYGAYREDGFYLLPTSAYLRSGQVQADFAADRL